jgi:hypothetical protein
MSRWEQEQEVMSVSVMQSLLTMAENQSISFINFFTPEQVLLASHSSHSSFFSPNLGS